MNTLTFFAYSFFAYSYRLFGLAFRFCCCAAGGCGKYYGKNRRGKRKRERRLIEAGFLPEASHVGKRRWKDPDTGRSMPRGAALDKVERREEQELEDAGWEQVEV